MPSPGSASPLSVSTIPPPRVSRFAPRYTPEHARLSGDGKAPLLSASPPDPARVQEDGQRAAGTKCFPRRRKPRGARSSAAERHRPENNVEEPWETPSSPGAGRSAQARAFPRNVLLLPESIRPPGKKHRWSLPAASLPVPPCFLGLSEGAPSRAANGKETGTAAKKSRENWVLAEGIALRNHQNLVATQLLKVMF